MTVRLVSLFHWLLGPRPDACGEMNVFEIPQMDYEDHATPST